VSEPVPVFLPRSHLQRLIDALQAAGRQCIGPVERDGALVFEPIVAAEQLPVGVHDAQSPGSYTLRHSDSPRCFAWANGPQALKPLTFAAQEPLWQVKHNADGLQFEAVTPEPPQLAVIGARGCDLAALRLQEAHFLDRTSGDPAFRVRRDALFVVAVDCAHPADTCFCASTGDGPAAGEGYDIALHELDDGFLVRADSMRGQDIVNVLGLAPASAAQQQAAAQQLQQAAAAQSRHLPAADLRDALFARQDHPHWAEVAGRCLACGNCTAVCPTCFCSSYEARPALDGDSAVHVREWDSCFSFEHSNLHGHALRDDISLRYRQWLTHKLGGWHDQYGRSGCTGCGRCISWCPVGIDLTVEVAALLEGEAS
jgi:ferredoxin